MKKHNFLNKTVTCLIAIGMSTALFTGCQSSSTSSQSSTSSSSQSTSNTQKSTNKPSNDQMKKNLQSSLQSLVKAGTITQAQADKIVTAYTERPTGTKSNNQQDKQQGKQTPPKDNSNKTAPTNSPLSKLVSSGVITQAQADAVKQKIGNNLKPKGNEQSSQNNTTKSSN